MAQVLECLGMELRAECIKDWVCADCGHEQHTSSLCEHCLGFRVILISVAAEHFGPNWRDAFIGGRNE